MNKKRIFIVEDEETVARYIEVTLLSLEYECAGKASDAKGALAKIGEASPDLVLMDIVLQGNVGGIEIAREILDKYDIPVVYLTGVSEDQTLHQALRSEPYGYLTKPFQAHNLYVAIEIALQKHDAERKLAQKEQWISTILSSIGEGVIATDPYGHVLFVNPVAEMLTGWSHEEARQKNIDEIFRLIEAHSRTPETNPLWEAIRTGIIIGKVNDILLVSRDGKEIPILLNAAPARGKRGICGGVVTFQDISERKQAQEMLRKANGILQKNNEYLSALHETADTLAGRLGLKEVLDSLAKRAATLMNASSCYVCLIEEEKNLVTMQAATGILSNKIGDSHIASAGLTGYILRTGQPLILSDYSSWGERIPDPEYDRIRAIAGIPVKSGEKIVGVMGAAHHDPHVQFADEEIALLNRFAQLVAVAVDNARLYQSVQLELEEKNQAIQQLSALHGVIEKTRLTGDLHELYTSVHEIVNRLLPARNFYIALHNPFTDHLEFPYFVDEFDPAPSIRPAGKGLTEYVLRTGKPLLLSSEKLARLVEEGEVEMRGTFPLDWLGVPLKTNDRVIGVLAVQSYLPEVRYGEREKELLSFISHHLASVLELKQAKETIEYQAYYDPLTHLPNRSLFRDRFFNALVRARRTKEMVGVFFVDLDRFKIINDTLGHATGDSLLREVAKRLSDCLRQEDTVARLGGDEFLILLPGIHQAENAMRIAEKILAAFRPPFQIEHRELHLTASIGISLFPFDGEDVETLLKNADSALYRAKEQGRDNYQMYTPSLYEKASHQLAIENKLRRAFHTNAFDVYYQPQIQLATGKISGMEALIRWRSEEGKILLPPEFISVAEETGLIIPLGEWVLRASCLQNQRWRQQGIAPFSLAVNISGRQFQQPGLSKIVQEILEQTGFPPQDLELELTESTLMKDPAAAVVILKGWKDLGIKIAIDDFGTGYSSFSYLRKLPIDTLKLDASFVQDIHINKDSAAIVAAIISMAHTLRLQVVAEGVETREQYDLLCHYGCDRIQGFLVALPLPSQDLQPWLQRGEITL